jgi:hypothetical protein
MRRLAAALAIVSSASLGLAGQAPVDRTRGPRDLPPAAEPETGAMCVAPDPSGRVRARAAVDGEALRFEQDPSWLLARDGTGLTLRRFIVAGDVDSVLFERWDVETGGFVPETWTRTGSETQAGRLVSIFEPAWPADHVQARLARARVGFDNPGVYWGRYRGPARQPLAEGQVLSIRVGSSGERPSDVVRIDDTAQYASHVVNLVIPDFGDSELTSAIDLRPVTRRFYELFEDSYDLIAVVPFEALLEVGIAAYHQRVRNDVAGLGLPAFDRAADYGSQGRLLGVELFNQTAFGTNDVSNHELGHTWGHNFDWARIAGITRAGHSPGAHAPLMSGGESLVGAVLEPTRRVAIRADGQAAIERTPAPARQHPLDLYAMGLADPAALPEFSIFEDQGQFSATTSSRPSPGTAVAGNHKTVSVNAVMAAHGRREGPVLEQLHRATVIVSRNRLLTAAELAPWNTMAARHEDAAGTGIVDYEGVGSFAVTTAGRMRLFTGIRPRDAAPAAFHGQGEPDRFGPLDCRGFEFTSPPPARVRAGQRFTIAGRVVARDRTDFSQAMFRFWPSDDVSDRAERAYTEVSRAGLFSVDVEIRPGRDGQYAFEGFLFWPDAAPQYSRCRLSVVNVIP